MSERQIWITTFDLERLSGLIDGVRAAGPQNKDYLTLLEKELERAKVVNPEIIPGDVVTMNSVVRNSGTSSRAKKRLTRLSFQPMRASRKIGSPSSRRSAQR